jgi:hypothetical protein
MTITEPPYTLKRALAHLEQQPLVRLKTILGNRHVTSTWWFLGMENGVLWFQPEKPAIHCPGGDYVASAHTGLELTNREFEVGIEIGPEGFIYSRGNIRIAVVYLDPSEIK